MRHFLKFLVILMVWCSTSFAAFTEFYVQTTGSNLNAGSTTSDTALLTFTSGNWVAGTGVFTAAGADLSSVTVGMWASVYNDGATVGVFVGRITAVDDTADTVTVSLTAKSGTAPTDGTGDRSIKVGGAWKGPNATEDFPFGFVQATMVDSSNNQCRVNFKNNATYSITDNTAHANNGPLWFQGYTTTPGDGGRATIDGTIVGASYILLTISATDINVLDFILQNNGTTGIADGLNASGQRCKYYRITITAVRGDGFNINSTNHMYVECEAYGCNTSNNAGGAGFIQGIADPVLLVRCVSHDNTGSNSSGFATSSSASRDYLFVDCIADSNGQYGFFVDTSNTARTILKGCDAYNNGSDGVRFDSATGPNNIWIENCNFVSNGGYGVNKNDASINTSEVLLNNGFFSNTSGQVNGMTMSLFELGRITYTASPYTDAANGNFTVNTAEAKAAGRGAFGGFTATIGYPDVGASQGSSVKPTTGFAYSN